MWQASLPIASVMFDAMAPPFRSSENPTTIGPAAGECRRSLTYIRVLGQGRMVQEDATVTAALPHLAKKCEQAHFQLSSGGCWVISFDTALAG
jgi:hypothetical protein